MQQPCCYNQGIDLADTPIPGSILSTFTSDSKYVVTPQLEQLDVASIEFNHAETFWGVPSNNGNDPEGIQIRQGIAHLIDKEQIIQYLQGSADKVDCYAPPAQSLPCSQTSQNGNISPWDVCSWDPTHPSCVSAYNLQWDPSDSLGVATGSSDFCAAADHFIAAGLATGKDQNCVLTGLTSNAATLKINFIVATSAQLGLNVIGNVLSDGINRLMNRSDAVNVCYATWDVITQIVSEWPSYAPYTPPNLSPIKLKNAKQGPSSIGIACSSGGSVDTWNMITVSRQLDTTPNQLYFDYNSINAFDSYSNPDFDHWSSLMELNDTAQGMTLSAETAEYVMGKSVANIPVYSSRGRFVYLNGWTNVVNVTGLGPSNLWTMLNAWNPNPAISGPTMRWGIMGDIQNLNPFLADTTQEWSVLNEVYDPLLQSNPYASGQIFGWMVNSYQIVQNPGVINPTAQTDSNCPLNVQTADGTWPVDGCIRMTLRGDISWQDIYNCNPTDSACLEAHTLTAQDVKFSLAAYNQTGGIVSPYTRNTVDVLYNPGSLPSSAFGSFGGAQANGQPEIVYIALKNIYALTLSDLTHVPIVPQHLWQSGTPNTPCLSPAIGSANINDTYVGTGPCTVGPAFLSPSMDPVSQNMLIGSGPWACANGIVGASGTTYGGGCTSTNSQSLLGGDFMNLRRFQYQGTSTSQQGSLNLNYAYFRTNGKFKNFAWADYFALGSGPDDGLGAHGVVAIQDIQSVASCLGKSAPAGTCTAAVFAHWSAAAATLSTVPAAGPNIGVVNGGSVPVSTATVAQVSRWYQTQWYDQQASTASLPAPLLYGVNGNQLMPGSLSPPGTGQQLLYEDATNETS